MFLINGLRAKLRQYNRNENNNVFDDMQYKEISIKCCPYDVKQGINFGIYTVPEATGYYVVPRYVDVQEGDQIIFEMKCNQKIKQQTHTILDVQDNWIFNRIENKIIAIK